MNIRDIHTHNPEAAGAIYNLSSPDEPHFPHSPISVGVHPWLSGNPEAAGLMQRVTQRILNDPAVVAIGETGLDARRGAPLHVQEALFRQHIQLSELTHMPIILHIVGAWSELLRIRKETHPSAPWIIHGFRGKPALTRQLLDAGFYLSIGHHYNPDSAAIIPSGRLLIESDEAPSTPAPPPHYDPSLPDRLFNSKTSGI